MTMVIDNLTVNNQSILDITTVDRQSKHCIQCPYNSVFQETSYRKKLKNLITIITLESTALRLQY